MLKKIREEKIENWTLKLTAKGFVIVGTYKGKNWRTSIIQQIDFILNEAITKNSVYRLGVKHV